MAPGDRSPVRSCLPAEALPSDPFRAKLESRATELVDAVVTVHRAIGPGLLESAYQLCLTYELSRRGVPVRCEVPVPVRYDGLELGPGYRLDLLVDDLIIVENKSVQCILPVHLAQLMTYLRLADRKLGFLINWNTVLVKDGIKRMVNGL